jgi:hypothetical protein
MNTNVTNMLSYRMRRLTTAFGEGPQLADAVRQLLEDERNIRIEALNAQAAEETRLSLIHLRAVN